MLAMVAVPVTICATFAAELARLGVDVVGVFGAAGATGAEGAATVAVEVSDGVWVVLVAVLLLAAGWASAT
jgi:hypothetical protein